MMLKWEYRHTVAAIYAVVLFLDRLDLTIVNIALPAIATYFHVAITDTEWINNAFLLALTLSIPISGWAGDRFGDKRIFVTAISLFGLSSLLCAMAPNLLFMIVMRFLQGLAGGLIIPVGMGMVFRAFEPSEYVSISSYIFIPTLIAPAIAPAIGGLMIYYFNWTWVFLFAVPICVAATALSLVFLNEKKIIEPPPLDWIGFILSALTLTFVLYALSSIGNHGLSFLSLGTLVSAGLLGYAFLRHERQSSAPLIDIKFFQDRLFLQANLIQLAFQVCHFGSIFLVGVYLQIGAGMSALMAGMIMGMQALGAICTSRLSVKLFNQYNARLPMIIGFSGIAFFSMAILWIDASSPLALGLGLLFVRGLFSGLCGAPLQAISILGFHKDDVSRASSVFNIGRQLSISLGIALSSLLLGFGFRIYGIDLVHPQTLNNKVAFLAAFLLIPVMAFLGILVIKTLDDDNISALRHRPNL